MITFAIPTWRRAERLHRCVTSIATQIVETGLPVKICISDNASDDGTEDLIDTLKALWPTVDIQANRLLNHVDYAENFKAVVEMVDTPWTWLLGDDDELMPGALATICYHIERANSGWPGRQLFYASPDIRVSDMPGGTTESTLLDLCCRFGFMDTLGYMSALVFRTEAFKAGVADVAAWDCYKENSFVHACVLLERLGNEPAVIIDQPMVRCQDGAGDDTTDRWLAEKIGTRYFLISDAFKFMMQRGVLPPKLPARFFRYHQFYLWDRFCSELMSMFRQSGSLPDDLLFQLVMQFAEQVSAPELAKFVHMAVNQVKFTCATAINARNAFDHLQGSFHHATIPSMKLMVP